VRSGSTTAPRLSKWCWPSCSELLPGIRPKAAATWTAIDRQLTNNAIWVPTVSEREVDLVSKRLHNYEYNPVWGFLTDQSWLG
jgi:hypothetical protein